MPRYWLDANVLIEANNRSYPIDVAKTFWLRMAEQIQLNNIVSCRRVYQELAEQEKHQDAIADFVRSRRKHLCLPPTREVQKAVDKIESYVFGGRYPAPEAWKFSKGGDPWVVAHAMVEDGVVVTQESALRPQAHVTRVPDVCREFKVECVNTLEMFRRLGITF